MKNLYELTSDYIQLYEMLEAGAETPEDEAEIIAAIEETGKNLSDKADAYARIIKNLSAEAEALKAEEKRLSARRKACENGVERLKNNMLLTMQTLGADKLKTSIGTWAVQKNPWSCDVTDVSKVPARFLIEQPPTVDKKAILAAFKETGEVFDGVDIRQSEGVRFR